MKTYQGTQKVCECNDLIWITRMANESDYQAIMIKQNIHLSSVIWYIILHWKKIIDCALPTVPIIVHGLTGT